MTTLAPSPPQGYRTTPLPQPCGCPACQSGLGYEDLITLTNSEWLINRLVVQGNVVVLQEQEAQECDY